MAKTNIAPDGANETPIEKTKTIRVPKNKQQPGSDVMDAGKPDPEQPGTGSLMRIDIRKSKIKNDLFIEAMYTERRGDDFDEFTRTSNAPIHDDLRAAFAALDKHLNNITEQNVDDELIHCSGFTIGSNDDGVCLIGWRDLKSDSRLNLISPFTRWSSDYCSGKRGRDLGELIETAKTEVHSYLFESKHAPKIQLEMSFTPEPGEQ